MSKWISVKNRLPNHDDTIHVSTPGGQAICIFVDSIEMNKALVIKGYPEEQVDVKQKPYYFCSQETKQHTLNGVTHWMPLPANPKVGE